VSKVITKEEQTDFSARNQFEIIGNQRNHQKSRNQKSICSPLSLLHVFVFVTSILMPDEILHQLKSSEVDVNKVHSDDTLITQAMLIDRTSELSTRNV